MNIQARRRLALFILILLLLYLFVWIIVWLFPLFSNPFLVTETIPSDGILVSLIPISLGFIFVAFMYRKKQPATVHGSAHFATDEELKIYGALTANPHKEQQAMSEALATGNTLPSRMHLGLYRKKLIVLDEWMQESHVFLLAPTGAGKTSRIIVPALLRELGSRSLFINDTKGELVELTRGHLSRYYHCLVFAPTNPHTSHHYNPLAHVRNMDDTEALASCLIENTGMSREEFWNSAPKLLVAAAVLYLRDAEPNAPFSRLIDLLCGTRFEELETLFRSSSSSLIQKVVTALFENLQKNDRLAGSIMVDMATRFFRFHNPSIRAVTSSNDLDFARMVDEPTALFLSIPEDEAHQLEPLSACLVMQMMSSLLRRATRNPGQRLPRGFVFYLDEFCNAGIIPKFTKYISTVRSRGIAFILAVQDFGQLRATYGEDGRETILANCKTHIVFPGCGLQETRYYSEKLGKSTVETISRSKRDTTNWFSAPHAQTYGETQRDLMTPDELRTMHDGTLLVLISSLHPILVDNIPYYQDRDLLTEVNLPFTPPASPMIVMPIPSMPPLPVRGLFVPNAASTIEEQKPMTPPPGPQQKIPPSTNQSDVQFFSPE